MKNLTRKQIIFLGVLILCTCGALFLVYKYITPSGTNISVNQQTATSTITTEQQLRQVYVNSGYISFYDSNTFEVIQTPSQNLSNYSFLNYTYVKDKNGVYFGKRKIEGADSDSFTVFTVPKLSPGQGGYVVYSYAKDKNAVYYSTENTTEVVQGADPKTFTPLSDRNVYMYNYGEDAKFVYKGTAVIPEADPKTVIVLFQPIYAQCNSLTGYIKDSIHVFYNETMVSGADPKTFEVLGGGYGRDKNGIWQGAQLKSNLPLNFIPNCPSEG